MPNTATARRSAGVKRAAKSVARAEKPVRFLAVTNFAGVYRAGQADRVSVIKHGVPAAVVVQIAKSMGAPKEYLFKTLGLSRATIDRKLRTSRPLSPDEGQRVVGVAKLVGQVQTMVEQSGDPKGFDAAKWLARWIDEGLPALGGKKPAEFLDTAEGQELVANTLLRMQSGAYS